MGAEQGERGGKGVWRGDDLAHPAINYLHNTLQGPVYLGGPITGIQQPVHYDFKARRDTPNELRAYFRKMGWRKVVAFQTRNPLHRAHQELTFRAAREAEANLLIHPVVGMTKPGDVDHFTRVRCYEAVLDQYPASTTHMSLLNLAMRMAGPREAVWHGLIRRNHGVTHFIVGRDHAGPGKNSQGKDFYGPYDAQDLFKQHEAEIGVTMVDFKHMVYVQEKAQYFPANEVPEGCTVLDISGTELRRRLREGLDIPEWFSFPQVVTELRRTSPPRAKQGFTVFFTGLSGSGKSTIANALMVKLMEMGGRPVTLLDGDVVRKHLSSELGFSKEHRDINIKRIGYVASEITKNGGIAICAPIAPYTATRRAVREMIEAYGAFIEVHVATSVEECEKRDRKGLYKLAREGKIKEFTGISDPYEAPTTPEMQAGHRRSGCGPLRPAGHPEAGIHGPDPISKRCGGQSDARIIEQKRCRWHFRRDHSGGRSHGRFVCDVQGKSSRAGQRLGGGFELRPGQVDHRNGHALGSQRLGCSKTDARRSAGNDRRATFGNGGVVHFGLPSCRIIKGTAHGTRTALS
jgi:sulfate adenylyltransferase